MGKIDVKGDIDIHNYLSATNTNLYLSSASNSYSIRFRIGTTEVARISPEGCLNINTTQTSDTYKLYVNGLSRFANTIVTNGIWPSDTNTRYLGQKENLWYWVCSRRYYLYDGTNMETDYGRLIVTTQGTTAEQGVATLYLGNTQAALTNGGAQGRLVLYSNTPNYARLQATTNATGNTTHYLPDVGGTLLNTGNMTSHLNSIYVKKAGDTMTGSLTVSDSANGNRGVWAKNSNGCVGIYTSTNRGLYDDTRGIWLLYTKSSDNTTRIASHLYPGTAGSYNFGSYTSCFNNMYANAFYVTDDDANVSVGYGNLRVVEVGTTSATGVTQLNVGNSTATGTAGNAYGRIYFGSTGAYGNYLYPVDGGATTAIQYFYFPNTGGTLVTHATRGTAVGSATKPVYIANTGRATACTYANTVVQQSRSTSTSWRPILSHNVYTSMGTDPGTAYGAAYYNETISIRPSNGSLYMQGWLIGGSGLYGTSTPTSGLYDGRIFFVY